MQEYPHRIRLRGPWEYEPVLRFVQKDNGHIDRSTDQLPKAGRMTMPCHWRDGGLEDFAGIVYFRRRFGYPGRIDDYERVWLTFAAIAGRAAVALNGHNVGRFTAEDCPCEFEITKLLQPRNELVVEVEALTEDGGLPGEVALEIRRTAFLKDVQARQEGSRLRVTGRIVGTNERPLDVYVLVGRQTVGYAAVELVEGAAEFEIGSELADEDSGQLLTLPVRIELVDGGIIWYGVEVSRI